MLSKFLNQNKKEIIELCRSKVLTASDSKPTSALLEKGLPLFYDELIGVLDRSTATAGTLNDHSEVPIGSEVIREGDAAAHGKESLRLGYTISQVVHAYGAVCQSITEMAYSKSFSITSFEFHELNLSLDVAIAEAVTEYEKTATEATSRKEVERLGFLIHEMGNSLVSASIAADMIKKGQVGNAGSTSKLLTDALDRMRNMINSSLAEIRFRGHKVEQTSVRLMDIIIEIEATKLIKESMNEVKLEITVDPSIQLTTDRQLIFSALSNVMGNALNFTKKHGKVTVSGKKFGKRILIEVEDECGGLPDGNPEDLFKSFAKRGTRKTGMGLGLSLSRKAIQAINGKLTVRNIPGIGCVFTIDLPRD